jgi:copper chaperone NosL
MNSQAPTNGGRAFRISLSLMLSGAAAALLFFSVARPLWHMRMVSPQYQDEEALDVVVYPHKLQGDLREIEVLNQYIGVHMPETLPQFRWMPGALMGAAIAGIFGALLPRVWRKRALVAVPLLLSLAMAFAAFQAQRQMHDIGHKRDAKTKMARTKDFTPPLLGSARLANFTLTASLGAGAYMIGAAVLLQLGAAWVNRGGGRVEAAQGSETRPSASLKSAEGTA